VRMTRHFKLSTDQFGNRPSVFVPSGLLLKFLIFIAFHIDPHIRDNIKREQMRRSPEKSIGTNKKWTCPDDMPLLELQSGH